MTQFVHLLTAAAIFVHGTMGCCAHEAHGMSEPSCEPSDCCQAEYSSSEQGHDHPESQPPVPHECHHADCTWPAPEAQNCADLVLLDMFLNSADCIQWTSTISLNYALGNGVLGNGFDSPLLLLGFAPHTVSVRAHLAKCVLLI